jgi:hypothetical protein
MRRSRRSGCSSVPKWTVQDVADWLRIAEGQLSNLSGDSTSSMPKVIGALATFQHEHSAMRRMSAVEETRVVSALVGLAQCAEATSWPRDDVACHTGRAAFLLGRVLSQNKRLAKVVNQHRTFTKLSMPCWPALQATM